MANVFSNGWRGGNSTVKQDLHNKYVSARTNLLFVVIFTVVNILLLVFDSDSYFLFSAYIPYFAVTMGMLLCGRFSAQFYEEIQYDMEFIDNFFFVATLIFAAVIVILYVLSWLLSKKHKVGWLIFGLIFFALDTLAMFMLGGISIDMILDIVFHGWVIFELSRGIYVHYKWRELPDEEIVVGEGNGDGQEDLGGEASSEGDDFGLDSSALRAVDNEVKFRILLETEAFGHNICYRRVKKVNELVIDGYVYDEYSALMESPHILSANIDGRTFQAAFNGAKSMIIVDGNTVAQKVRWY